MWQLQWQRETTLNTYPIQITIQYNTTGQNGVATNEFQNKAIQRRHLHSEYN